MTLDTTVLDNLIETLRPRVSRAVNVTGLKIASMAAANAPVDTGALRNSILSESHMEGDLMFVVQDGVAYGLRQELGFVGEDSLGRTYHQAAHPFMIPAVESGEGTFISEIGKAITP